MKKLVTWTDEVTGALVVRMPGRDDQHGRVVCVVTDQGSSNFWEHLEGGKQLAPIARRYYAAHPETKPWHDAKRGEVWAVTWDGEEVPCIVEMSGEYLGGLGFKPMTGYRETLGVPAPLITAARRIWPEVSV